MTLDSWKIDRKTNGCDKVSKSNHYERRKSHQIVAENILSKEVIETRLDVHTKANVILPARKITAIKKIPFEVICTAKDSPFPSWNGQGALEN